VPGFFRALEGVESLCPACKAAPRLLAGEHFVGRHGGIGGVHRKRRAALFRQELARQVLSGLRRRGHGSHGGRLVMGNPAAGNLPGAERTRLARDDGLRSAPLRQCKPPA